MPTKPNTNPNFNPVLIVSQIFFILSIFYISNIFFTLVFNRVFGMRLHLDQILSSDAFEFSTKYGHVAICAFFFTYMIQIITCTIIIDKAYKVLDYVLTNFFIHFVLTCMFSHFPTNFIWWIIQGIYITVVILVAENISLRIAQKDIKLDFNLASLIRV
jgi:hypothetical protein